MCIKIICAPSTQAVSRGYANAAAAKSAQPVKVPMTLTCSISASIFLLSFNTRMWLERKVIIDDWKLKFIVIYIGTNPSVWHWGSLCPCSLCCRCKTELCRESWERVGRLSGKSTIQLISNNMLKKLVISIRNWCQRIRSLPSILETPHLIRGRKKVRKKNHL